MILSKTNSNAMKREIVIIDDDSIYRMVVSITLKNIDASLVIHECEDGQKGLAKLQDLTNSDAQIIVILDINMPVLDGWRFLDALEENKMYRPDQLVIYMVSSSIDKEDVLRAQHYGFVKRFLHKPLVKDDFASIVGAGQRREQIFMGIQPKDK